MKLSLVLSNWLKNIGASNVFGVTGGSVVHLLHGAEEVGLNVIYTHHEQAASFAAVASSRIKGLPNACMVTTGPGGTNAITGLASAYLDSIPCVFISGQARSEDAKALNTLRQSGSQHLDIVNVVKPLSKTVYQLKDSAEELFKILELAEHDLLNGRPGPIWIDIPLEFQWANIEGSINKGRLNLFENHKNLLEELKDVLLKSKRPIFVLGYGCRLAKKNKDLVAYCKRNNIPYVLTWNTLDFASFSDNENCGLLGISGTREANLAVNYSDLVIGFGTHLSKLLTGDDIESFAPDAKDIFIYDIDDSESIRFKGNKRFKYKKIDLRELDITKICEVKASSKWIDLYTKIKTFRSYRIIEECKNCIPKNSINQYEVYEYISKSLREDDIIVVDGGGNVLFSVLQSIKLKTNNRLITGAGIGCMGSALPEAIGACIGSQNRVLCFIGDGSLQFNIQELQTIKHHKLNIVVILFNNDGYLAIKNTQDNFFDRRFGVDKESGLSLPDFAKLVKAYEISYISMDSLEDLRSISKTIENIQGPYVIEVKISEKTPLLPRGGFKKDKDGNNIRRPPWDPYPSIENLPQR